MDIEMALEQLSANNFDPRLFVFGEEKQIRCFVERHMIEGTNLGMAEMFAIVYRDNYWKGIIPGGIPYNTIISRSTNLADVVDEVCDFYNLRETTPSDDMTLEEAVNLLEEGGLTFSAIYEDIVWGRAPRRVQTPDGLISESFSIDWYVGAWLAIYITLEKKSRPIKYSKSLGDVVQAVLDFYHEQDEVHPEK